MTPKPSTIRIRNAKSGDVDAMLGLLRELFAIEADFTFDEARQRRGLFLMTDGCMKHKVIKVAETDRQIVGMAGAQTLISTAEGGQAVLVEDVVVAPAFRGCGIGKSLMKSIGEWAESRGVNRLQLLADTQNQPALDFYRHLGWQKTQLICFRRMVL
ncbi:MAG: GNAT family N-acetyltransferase [Thermodesulfobacteriota bacterium]|nr:GNAT family N-acetyltransferase [Thermodesulfobacteriota bacterium]